MIKRTINYTDFDGNKVSEDWHFHISKAEALELEANDGKTALTEALKAIMDERDSKKMFAIFKDLLKTAVGKRSPDGKRFSKSQDIVDTFVETGACDELVFELLTGGDTAEFFNGFLPTDVQEKIKDNNTQPVPFQMPVPASAEKPKVSIADLRNMSAEDFDSLKKSPFQNTPLPK